MNVKHITLPLSEDDIKNIKCGDMVYLSGTIFSARDQAHKRIYNALLNNEKTPFELKNACIYYAGPCPTPDGKITNSFGPTTSSRMDLFTPLLIENGLKIMIGKGKRSEQVINSIKKHGCLYFSAIGCAGALCGNAVKSMQVIAYPELLSEAVRRIEIENFPLICYVDSYGNSL